MDLSILIPARNEEFLGKTIENLLENIRGDTEIIAVLDGYKHDVPQDPRVTVIYHKDPIGQRAATNMACRLSRAKYVMKMDAHCAVDEGFDKIMMEDMKDHYTMVPVMKNLHAFDWVCPNGHRRYQGPSGPCKECGKPTEKDILWKGKPSPNSTAYRFDRTLHFQYWGAYKKLQKGDIVDTMSLQGSCWMATREKYWELGLCDEGFGSWGQQGVEVACKTWLSGGEVKCNKKTWYAHMFRTQGGDFGFPYKISGKDVNKARNYSRNLFLDNKWDKAIHPFSWLIEKFNPPDWDFSKGLCFYTDNRLDLKIADRVQTNLVKASGGHRIVSVSLGEKVPIGDNICMNEEPGYLTMFKQILAGLEELDTDVVFLCEHDVLYHPSHFEFVPPRNDRFYYNTNVYKYRIDDGIAVRVDDCRQTSGLCAYRDLLLEHYRKRVRLVEQNGFSRKMGFEPGTHSRKERIDDYKSERWESKFPNIDLRHSGNLTSTRTSPDQFRNKKYAKGWTEVTKIPGWKEII